MLEELKILCQKINKVPFEELAFCIDYVSNEYGKECIKNFKEKIISSMCS